MRSIIIIPIIGLLFLTGCLEQVGDGFTSLFQRDIKAEATIAEINAVSNLKSDEAMEEGFLAIASRPNLSPAAQKHLIVPALTKLYHESSKVQVLLTLVNNPDFTHQAKKKILKNLSRLESEKSRAKVLSTINQRKIGAINKIPPSEDTVKSVLTK